MHAGGYLQVVFATVPKDQKGGTGEECAAQLSETLHDSFVELLHATNTGVNAQRTKEHSHLVTLIKRFFVGMRGLDFPSANQTTVWSPRR